MVRLTEKQIQQKIDFIDEYIGASNASTGSKLDANANVETKNIATLSAELNKDINIQINRKLVCNKIEELFGKDLSDEYVRQIESHEIYSHDETNLCPYCVSISMYPFLLNGMKDLGGNSGAPKNLNSFCGSFVNLVFAISAQFSGAVATVEFLNYFDYFARQQFGENYLIQNEKDIEQHLQSVVYAINQPASARGFQCCFWNISIFDRFYFDAIFGDFHFPDGTRPNWKTLEKLQRFFMKWFNAERKKALLTFPVVTATILSDGEQEKDHNFVNMLSKELSEGNSFFMYTSDSADSLASCCRVRNELMDNTFSFSLGAGGVATGSKNVITLNMSSLLQEKRDLKIELEKIYKYQIAYNSIMEDYYNSGLLPVYSAGFISLKKQFLTIGINGIVEGAEALGYKPGNNKKYKEFLKKQLKIIYDSNRKASKLYNIMINCECVPSENLAIKNAKWDKEKGLKVSRDCYTSYFYPVEDSDINMLDKFILHGKEIVQYLDGGSALHLNLEEHPTSEAYKKMIRLAIKCGTNYFTTNVKITICNTCGHIDKRTLKRCSDCNSLDVGWATRVIGYLKKVNSFSEGRQVEESKRYYHEIKSENDSNERESNDRS